MGLCIFKTYLCFQRRAGGEGERAGEADGDHPKWDRGALSNSGSSLAGLSVLICGAGGVCQPLQHQEHDPVQVQDGTNINWLRAFTCIIFVEFCP